jgi:hypothetical protein
MPTCMHGVRLTADIAEHCAWCALEQRRAARVDDINRLRELIGIFGNLRRDVGAFSGLNSENARNALREASRRAAQVYDEIEQILYRLRNPEQPAAKRDSEVPPGASLRDPGQNETHACGVCGAFVEYVPPKFAGDPDAGWRHKGLAPSDVRAHIVMPQSL